jgi:hypothetical protein
MNKADKAIIAVGYVNSDDDEDICGFDYFEYKKQMTDNEILEHCKQFTKDVEYYKNSLGTINNGKIIKSDFKDNLIVELESINEEISKIKSQIKTFEDRKKYIESLIKQEIGQNFGFETDLYKVTMSNRITAPTYEWKICRSGLKIEYK